MYPTSMINGSIVLCAGNTSVLFNLKSTNKIKFNKFYVKVFESKEIFLSPENIKIFFLFFPIRLHKFLVI